MSIGGRMSAALFAMALMLAVPARAQDHSEHQTPGAPADQAEHDHNAGAATPTAIPALTDADRAAAFPALPGHASHDNDMHGFLLIDHLEGRVDGNAAMQWETSGWLGTDLDRLWLRSAGERSEGKTHEAELELLYGHSIATWWDVVAGLRHDFRPGKARSFAAVGVQGLAPQRFGIEATAYLGAHGHVAARLLIEHELLFTNRLILEPLLEMDLHGKNDPLRGIGSGLATAEAALRLRYEFTRQFAPYVGLVFERSFGRTASLRRDASESVADTSVVAGLRLWF